MQIIILAAGKGERLWPLTRNTPKCLLEIGDGRTLLEAQLLAIEQAGGVDGITIVTGYRSSQIEAKVKTLDGTSVPVNILYNPFYSVSNNLASLWLALQVHTGDLVVVNGDDLFHPHVLTGLIKASKKHNIVMTIDRKDHYDEDDMKIIDQEGTLLRVGKGIPADDATGESIGMITFRRAGRTRLEEAVNALMRTDSGLGSFWLAAVQHVVDTGWPVNLHEVGVDDWREMDFHPDREEIRRHLEAGAGIEGWLRPGEE